IDNMVPREPGSERVPYVWRCSQLAEQARMIKSLPAKMANPPSAPRTSLLPGRARELRFRRFVLRVIDGHDHDKGRERASAGRELSVGSEASNDLVLGDATVSRHHFVLQVQPDGVLLRDLDSTNGTTVAGYRVGSAYLKPGAVIGLGLTTLRFDD